MLKIVYAVSGLPSATAMYIDLLLTLGNRPGITVVVSSVFPRSNVFDWKPLSIWFGSGTGLNVILSRYGSCWPKESLRQ